MRDELLQGTGDVIEELLDKMHEAILKNRPSDAQDYAMALSSATSAYRDLMEARDSDAER